MLQKLTASSCFLFRFRFDEIRLRTGEKAAYKKLGQSEEIRFPIKKIDSTKDKVFVLFQAICAGL
jgi:ATP-dependent DNA helicase HFM1/MER3